jgi:hypothetical protein
MSMDKYPAIWKVKLNFDANLLLKEFMEVYPQNLEQVYSENENWKGVTIFKKKGNLLISLRSLN